MATVTRNEFVQELRRDGGALNVNDLSPRLEHALSQAGVSSADLERIAGRDGQLHTATEYQKLFRLLDRADSNGSSRSFNGRDEGETSVAGAAYDALRHEVNEHRMRARQRGVIHVGMRAASIREVRALQVVANRDGGVASIRAYADNGIVRFSDQAHDLTTARGLNAFRAAAITEGMPAEQAEAFVAIVSRQPASSRDEIAQLGLALYRTGRGALTVNRLVLSGHSGGASVYGDAGGRIAFADVAELVRVFPAGAGAIEHVALSACNSGEREHAAEFRAMFPNLKSFFGYDGFSPSAEKGAPRHLRRWEAMTDGDDPSQVQPGMGASATWNQADGYRGSMRRGASGDEQ